MHFGIDYRDRWRRHPDGGRKLTLRRIYLLLSVLPEDSAIGRHERPDHVTWTLEHYLLDDLRMAVIAGLGGAKKVKPHPTRPKPTRAQRKPRTPQEERDRRRRLADLQRRVQERAERRKETPEER